MEDTIKTGGVQVVKAALALLLVLSSCAGVLGASAQDAFAEDTAYLDVGGSIPYAGYSTSWMHVGASIAYCGNPSAATPASGTYSKQAIDAPSGRDAETTADLWFGYGSPGFDASLWPSAWYDGSAMTEERYVALTHILLSDTFTSDGSYALYGCSEDFKDWARTNVIGYDANGNMVNDNATGRQIMKRAGEVPSNFTAFMMNTGAATQLVLSFTYIPDGYVQVHKATSDGSITANNPNYSLAGAQYSVCDASGAVVNALTTDASGASNVSDALLIGTYTVKETKAPAGFALDTNTYTVTISPDTWDTNRVVALTPDAEVPQTGTDPSALSVTLAKQDVETGEQAAQGAATLEGAIFVVKHYALAAGSIGDAGALSGIAPDYTWTVTTDATGTARIESWTSSDGQETYGLPLGVCTIEETEAPTGYLLSDTVQIFDVVASGTTQHFDLTGVPTVSDQVKRGDLELIKISDGDHARMAGVPFTITSKTTGEEHTIVTDANGHASTSAGWNLHSLDTNGSTANSGIWFGTSPTNDGTGALIYDTYTIEEQPCDANAGKALIPAFDITVSRDAYTVNIGTMTNDDLPRVTISKTDITTGTELTGAALQIVDHDGAAVEQWVSTDTPHEVSLEAGDYTLHEETAPDGYLVASDVAFSVVGGTVSQKVVMEDDCTKVDISKTDVVTGEELAGAHLQIIDKDGAVVEEWDTDGTARRVNALAPGDYTLRETGAPDGYGVAEDVAFTVQKTGDVQKVEMKDQATPAPDTPSTSTDESLPKTGDAFPWWILALVAGAGVIAVVGYCVIRVGDNREAEDEDEE